MLTEDFPSSEVSGPCHIVMPKYFKVTSAYDKIAAVKTLEIKLYVMNRKYIFDVRKKKQLSF